MNSTFFGINIGLRGLQAQQKGLEVSSHNIANANSPGYTRQRAVMQASTPFPVPALNRPVGPGQLGTGVEVAMIDRIRDAFLDGQIRSETASLGRWEELSKALEQAEIVFMEPGETGLATLLDQFWNSWQELSKYPESAPVRTTVVETANALAEALRHTHTQLTQIQDDIDTSMGILVDQVNTLADQIAKLNKQIVAVKLAGDQPNDLLDQRDRLLDELSGVVNIQVKEQEDGSVTVTLANAPEGTIPLLEGTQHNILAAAEDENGEAALVILENNQLLVQDRPIGEVGSGLLPQTDYKIAYIPGSPEIRLYEKGSFVGASVGYGPGMVPVGNSGEGKTIEINVASPLPAEGIEFTFTLLDGVSLGGKLQGLFLARDTLVQGYINDLNKLANALAGKVNTIHQGGEITDEDKKGLDLYGNQGELFFVKDGTSDPPTSAGEIAVNPALISDVNMIAAASGTPYDPPVPPPPGDGTNALAIAQLRQQSVDFGESSQTIDDFYRNLVARLGVSANEANRMVENQGVLVDQLTNRKESLSGVSLDEEMANLVQFQRAYEAAARVITTMDSLLDTLINRMAV